MSVGIRKPRMFAQFGEPQRTNPAIIHSVSFHRPLNLYGVAYEVRRAESTTPFHYQTSPRKAPRRLRKPPSQQLPGFQLLPIRVVL